ncbi:bifunctional phosphoribosylaminoimidazolecarboxamide formyltransferase/IMP cyclohydrolase [Papillibacter cinnamivorans]|uniref:Bifunctional purine biosynthesis protein PurH n=1 Tax=Papillibacter cinnamivorans DSM 12816 TaxID=1122930 RepID=A0A1W1Z3B3_9FIRM|nr:bifunctional phosphoribosylaminoimidazolecarboxamide formyltransferase/IMP cyclohydrolase [Papillibacter cinnamivorans]SMC42591.1 phosphoribosylaminoimidazolecarboxamide formyltransferase / IMP cyclohydrolase [Papillibacter cinnamivorans DSM 12816]
MKRRALISVSDKTGVVDFARRLHALGFEIVSTGGTQKALESSGIPVLGITEVTGFPECLDGRLKTLHPAVHGGILAMRSNPEHMKQLEELGIVPIDVLVINLYPFRETILRPGVTLPEAIENIDIGGPTMLRAAAKNWQDVAVVTDPGDYDAVVCELEQGEVSRETKYALALKVFETTAQYDAMIAGYLRRVGPGGWPERLTLTFDKAQDLRYGENPHQSAAFYREIGAPAGTIAAARQLHGKELSYNNIGDAGAAVDIVKDFSVPCAVALKHANPCGVGIGSCILEAFVRAREADPVSIYGGIVALNRECDGETAAELSKLFLEIIIAPSFSPEALAILEKKQNLRLMALPGISLPNTPDMLDMKKVGGGLLVQSLDCPSPEETLRVVTRRAPTEAELTALRFGWRIVRHVKSNAVVLTTDTETVGVGPGQTNRVTALELAIKYAGDKARGSVMASDAYFPFRDCVDAAAAAGVTAIIQPGGSIRDQQSIDACDEAGIAMVFTGVRHFRH